MLCDTPVPSVRHMCMEQNHVRTYMLIQTTTNDMTNSRAADLR